MIIALDTALRTGFAYGTEGNITFGTRDFSGVSRDTAVLGRRFRGWLAQLLTETEPSMLVIERPVHFAGARNGATTMLHGFAWEAHRAAEIRNIPRVEYSPITIKKFITDNGRASKEEVIKAVRERGYKVTTDNEADAVALLLLQKERL